MKTTEIKFIELCDEVDYWKERAEKAEADAEYWKNEYNSFINERLASSQRDVANALMIALSAHNDKDGNLVIDKESRKKLVKNYK
jgi:hypothetical protein